MKWLQHTCHTANVMVFVPRNAPSHICIRLFDTISWWFCHVGSQPRCLTFSKVLYVTNSSKSESTRRECWRECSKVEHFFACNVRLRTKINLFLFFFSYSLKWQMNQEKVRKRRRRIKICSYKLREVRSKREFVVPWIYCLFMRSHIVLMRKILTFFMLLN